MNCPLCAYYDAWNATDLREHIADHKEMRRYRAFWQAAKEEHQTLRERQAHLRERLDALSKTGMLKNERRLKIERTKQELRMVQSRLQRFQTCPDTRVVESRERQFDSGIMTELLYG